MATEKIIITTPYPTSEEVAKFYGLTAEDRTAVDELVRRLYQPRQRLTVKGGSAKKSAAKRPPRRKA